MNAGIIAASILKQTAPGAARCGQRNAVGRQWNGGLLHDSSHELVPSSLKSSRTLAAAAAEGGWKLTNLRSE